MSYIKAGNLISFCKTLRFKEQETLVQKKKFFVRVIPDGLEYIPQSTKRPRKHPRKLLQRVCEKFSETRSFRPSDYHDITVHASYVLSLIDSYIKAHPSTYQ